MIKRTAFALSAVALVIGAWMVTSLHSLNTSCATLSGTYAGSVVTTSCSRVASSCVMGYVLVVGSLVILVLGLFHVTKRDRNIKWSKGTPVIPHQAQRSIGTLMH